MFYGKVVNAGKPVPLVPHPDGYSLHLSQASLSSGVKLGSRLSLLIKVADEEPVVLCTLRAGAQDTVLLDQFLDEYAELSVDGEDSIHVTGYYSPQFGGEGESEEEGEEYEDDEYGVHPMHTVFGEPDSSDEGDSDDEDESDGEYDTDDEDENVSDDVVAAHRKEPSVIIEDITDKDKEQELKALPAPVDSKKRKAEAAADAATKKQALDKQQLENGQQQQQLQPKQQPKAKGDKQPQQPKEPKQQASKPEQQHSKQEQKQQKLKQKEQKQQPAANPTDGKADGASAAQPVSSKKGVRRYENGFEVHSVKMGDPHGKLAKAGKQVKVKYVGKLKKTGQVFDKTQKKPFCFRLGVGEVIKGWDAGVEGMRVGDVRKLVIPPQMAYGAQRTGPIPPNSTLDFEVELVDVK